MKSVVRSEVLSHLQSLSGEEKKQASSRIQLHLQQELKSASGVWSGYKALGNEPDIDWNETAPHLKWVFPVASDELLKFKNPTNGFKKAALGLLEPEGAEVSLNEISGFVIPGLAYDQAGYRLGRGKGYYDRTLAGTPQKKIGVCFEVSILKDIPVEDHDVRCDKIITEKQVYVVKSEGEQKWN